MSKLIPKAKDGIFVTVPGQGGGVHLSQPTKPTESPIWLIQQHGGSPSDPVSYTAYGDGTRHGYVNPSIVETRTGALITNNPFMENDVVMYNPSMYDSTRVEIPKKQVAPKKEAEKNDRAYKTRKPKTRQKVTHPTDATTVNRRYPTRIKK